jgi:hypothetical protein
MQMNKIAGARQKSTVLRWVIFFNLIFLCSCTQNRFPNLIAAEEEMVRNCQYLETVSETSDPGKPGSSKYAKLHDGELKVLQRAHNLGATHIVWLYNYAIGSSASVYRCEK